MFKALSKVKFADIEALKKRYLIINRERLNRAEDCMRSNQRDFLDFLPLLFHVNHPRLPGYISKEAPSGICDYIPSKRALTAANKYINHFEYKKRAMARYDIMSMFLMGSSGTVAYSKKSDFDIWLCHQHSMGSQELAELQDKATAIEEWADGQGLEVHFFLMDAVNFKEGKIVDLSSESSGTAQYYLLLEEFYRTSLLLAGRFPVWWLVPVEEEANYDNCVKDLYKRRLVSEGECIDFGGIPTVPSEEFFGAALWQLFKGIDSPYKSVLKLLLMEVYASEYPDIELLCLRFKKAIFDGENDLDKLDPYLMLYKKLEEYLVERDELDRLELVRRCFYFKVNQRLSQPEPKQYDWRRDLMRSKTNSWGWEEDLIATLDNRSNWKIRQVVKERGGLVKELTYTYKFLSDFGRTHSQLSAINQHDLNALGRKLYAAFERKTGKVEIINRGISQNVWESVLTLYQIHQKNSDSGWALLSEEDNFESGVPSNKVALKRGRNVIELVVWAYFNGLMDGTTVVKVMKQEGHLSTRDIQEFIRDLGKLLPLSKVMATNVEDLSRTVRILQSVVVVNMGYNPGIVHKRGNQHLASNRIDAFSYGGMYETLVKSFDQLTLTSWKEIITSNHAGIEGIMACFQSYFKWMPPSRGVAPPLPIVLCYSSNHSMTIKQRVERLFSDVINCFYGSEGGVNSRYIFAVQRFYYVLYFEDDVFHYQRVQSQADLLRYLGKGRQNFGRIEIDRYCLGETLLPFIFKRNKPGVVQFFYSEVGKKVDIFVLDEKGSLFYQKKDDVDGVRMVGHFSQFFDAILQRQLFQLGGQGGESSGLEVEYHRLSRKKDGELQAVPVRVPEKERKNFFNIQVIAEQGGDKSSFTVYCNDQEFSSLEHGSDLFKKVAGYIIQMRQGGQRYPIFITDIDLPPSMFTDYGGAGAPTVDFLNYKKSIESKLNDALENFGRGSNVLQMKPRNTE